MIKNFVFDMGQVILKWSPEMFLKRENLSEEDYNILINEVFGSYNWQLLDYGYYETEEAFLEDVLPNIPERLHDTARHLVLHWDENGCECVDKMEEFVKAVRAKGYKIYLLSNAGPRHPQYWGSMNVSKYFDGTVVSALVKQHKPCPDIYETLLKRYDLKAEECIFIDDIPANCSAAYLLGFNTVVFRGYDNLVEKLRNSFNISI